MTIESKKLGILFLAEALHPGGAERQLSIILRKLDRSIFNVILITWESSSVFYLDNDGTDFDLTWIEIKRKNKFDLRPVLKASELLKSGAVQLIHGILDTGNLYAFLATRLARKGTYIASERSSRRTLSRLQRIHKPISHRFAATTISNSYAGLNFIKQLTNIPVNQLECIRNAINLEHFHPVTRSNKDAIRKKLGIPINSTIILSVGRIVPLKNQYSTIQAFAQCKPDNGMLYFLGDGIIYYLDKCKSLAQSLGVEKKIKFIEAQQNIIEWYQMADLHVLNSDYEGSPNVIIESLACGIPVISTNVGDVSYFVDNTCGWIIPPHNTEALTIAIKSFLLTSVHHRIQIGKNGRLKLEGLELEEDKVVRKYETIYKNLILHEDSYGNL